MSKTNSLPYKVFSIKKRPSARKNNETNVSLSEYFCRSYMIIEEPNTINKLASFTNQLIANNQYNNIDEDLCKWNISKKIKSFFGSSLVRSNSYHSSINSNFLGFNFVSLNNFIQRIISLKDESRIILAPDNTLKHIQSGINNQLNMFKPHTNVFGFAKNKSALDSVNYHLFHNEKPELLINVDIKNFFGSFTESQIKKALLAHGLSIDDVDNIIKYCGIKLTLGNVSKLISQICCAMLDINYIRREILNKMHCSSVSRIHNLYPPRYYRLGSSINQLSRYNVDTISAEDRERILNNSVIFPLHGELTENNISTARSQDIVYIRHFISKMIESCILVAVRNKYVSKKDLLVIVKDLFNIGPKIELNEVFIPQGSPASPSLTNISFKIIDYKLNELASEYKCIYTRYADDLSFTWPCRFGQKFINIFIYRIQKILSSYGFDLNTKKSKVVGSGGRMEILGYVLNSGKPTIAPKYIQEVRTEIMSFKEKVKNGSIKNELSFKTQEAKIKGKINFIASASTNKAEKLNSLLSTIHIPVTHSRRISLEA